MARSQLFQTSSHSGFDYGVLDANGIAQRYGISEALAAEIVKVAQRVRIMDPAWLADIIRFESKFNPKAKNPGSSATGLIQFIDTSAKEVGTTTSALLGMSAIQQMAYVQKYYELPRIKKYAPFKTRLDTMMAVYWPAGVGKGPDYKFPSSTWAANHGIKTAGDYERMAMGGSLGGSATEALATVKDAATTVVDTITGGAITQSQQKGEKGPGPNLAVPIALTGASLAVVVGLFLYLRKRR